MQDEGQLTLFGGDEGIDAEAMDPPLPALPPWSIEQRLAAEQEALGFHFSGHPLERYGWMFSPRGVRRPGECSRLGEGAGVLVGGQVIRVKRLQREGQSPFSFVDLEDDQGGVISAALFDEAFTAGERVVQPGALVAIRGKLRTRKSELQLVVSSAMPLSEVVGSITDITVTVGAAEAPPDACCLLETVFAAHRGTRSAHVEVALPDGRAVVILLRNTEILPSEELVNALSEVPFVTGVAVTVGAES
jgi:DNA polymerase-3 subunit alpha